MDIYTHLYQNKDTEIEEKYEIIIRVLLFFIKRSKKGLTLETPANKGIP